MQMRAWAVDSVTRLCRLSTPGGHARWEAALAQWAKGWGKGCETRPGGCRSGTAVGLRQCPRRQPWGFCSFVFLSWA